MAAFLCTLHFFAPSKPLRWSRRLSSEQGTRWIYWVLALAWLTIFTIVAKLLPQHWSQIFSLVNVCGLYLILRLWPDREYEARAANPLPGAGTDSETQDLCKDGFEQASDRRKKIYSADRAPKRVRPAVGSPAVREPLPNKSY
jgi:hypothetical protein